MKRFHNILFVKSADNNEAALFHAITLAKRNQASLTLLETRQEIPDITDDGFTNDAIREAKRVALKNCRIELEQLAAPINDEIEIGIEVVEGRRFLTIIREVLRNKHDLVIKSTEPEKDLVSRLLSSNDMHLLRKCPCPVWLVKPDQPETVRRIAAAVDFDEPGENSENEALNRQILEMAISLAHREKAELHIIHAWQAIAENILSSARSSLPETEVTDYVAEIKASQERRLAELMKQAATWVGPELFDAVKPIAHAIKGPAHQVIAKQTRAINADLLVMGTVGRTGIPGFFIGNTAESILNWIDCSVLAVKPAGFTSPVTLNQKV
jgi:universal stress protein E